MSRQSLPSFETRKAISGGPEHPVGVETGKTPTTDLGRADRVVEMVDNLPGGFDKQMAALVKSTNEFAAKHPGEPAPFKEAKIADEAGMLGILGRGDTENTALTLGQQPQGPLEAALKDIVQADPSGTAVERIIKAIETAEATEQTPPIDPARALATLHPGINKDPVYVASANHAARHGDTKATSNSEQIVGAHLSRFEKLVEKAGIERVIDAAVNDLVIKAADVPEKYFIDQQTILRNNGESFDIVADQLLKNQLIGIVQESQRTPVKSWANELKNGTYPTWFKLYAWNGMSKMGVFDPVNKQFRKRSKGSVAPFPRVNPEALEDTYRYIVDALGGTRPTDEVVEKLVKSGNFNRIYSHAMLERRVIVPTPENAADVQGQWVEYGPNDKEALMDAAEGTPWCINGEESATMYLSKKDARFYLFHLQESKVDRLASSGSISVRMEGGRVAEVSGLQGMRQQLEDSLVPTAMDKLDKLPGGERYLKAMHDKEMLCEMDRKFAAREQFSVQELELLYEIHRPIEYVIPNERIIDQRIIDFRSRQSEHMQQLREVYGDDAEWMTLESGELAETAAEWLEKGMTPDAILRKLLQPISHLNIMASSVIRQYNLERVINYVYSATNELFPLFVEKGLSKEAAQEYVDSREAFIYPDTIKALLGLGFDASMLMDKMSSLDKGDLVVSNLQELLYGGIHIDVLANAVVDESGHMASYTEYPANDQPSGQQRDWWDEPHDTPEPIVHTPIEFLVAHGVDMNKFAAKLNNASRATHAQALRDAGVREELILAA